MEIQEQLLVVGNGYEVPYDHVAGRGNPVVFIPGFTLGSDDFHELMSRSGDRDLYSINVRGQGRSRAQGPYSIEQDIEDLAQFLQQLGVPATLVGHSRGALMAFSIAGDHPELVSGVYAIDATPFTGENPDRGRFPVIGMLVRTEAVVRVFGDEGHDSAWLRGEVGRLPFGLDSSNDDAIDAAVLDSWSSALERCDPDIWPAWLQGEVDPVPARQLVSSVQCPLRLIYGEVELGGVVTVEDALQVEALCSGASSRLIDGHGHFIHQLSPGTAADDLTDFLGAHAL